MPPHHGRRPPVTGPPPQEQADAGQHQRPEQVERRNERQLRQRPHQQGVEWRLDEDEILVVAPDRSFLHRESRRGRVQLRRSHQGPSRIERRKVRRAKLHLARQPVDDVRPKQHASQNDGGPGSRTEPPPFPGKARHWHDRILSVPRTAPKRWRLGVYPCVRHRAATVRERLHRRVLRLLPPIEKRQPLPAALLPPTFVRNTSVPVYQRPQRRSEALRFLLHARRFERAIEHQRLQTGHGAGAQPVTLVAYGQLSGGEILQAEQGQFETVFHANLLEQAREVYLYRALGDHQRGGDFLVLQTLRKKADQLAFALRQRHAAGAQEAVGERFLEPQLAGLDLLQAFHLQFRGQGLAQNAAHPQSHRLEGQFRRNRVHPKHDPRTVHGVLHEPFADRALGELDFERFMACFMSLNTAKVISAVRSIS